MITARVTPLDEPRPFAPHELFFSLTDEKGRIRYGNDVFTRVSGYTEEQLVGQPHNLIRHPDVPRCVFRLLWDYLESGRTIAAYVKNLAADGRYYWVLAVVTPCEGGYLSVRLNPSGPLFEAARAAYAEALRLESAREIEHGRQQAIAESLGKLAGIVRGHGFADYDQFMHAALRTELERRADHGAPALTPRAGGGELGRLHTALARVGDQLGQVFASLDLFDRLSVRLLEKRSAMEELGPSLTFLALNTHISATRLGPEGAVLSVVSRNLGERSKDADGLIATLMQRMAPACEAARAVAFDVAVAQLEAEVCRAFVAELIDDPHGATSGLVAESLGVLIGELAGRSRGVVDSLRRLRDDVDIMLHAARALVGQVEQMRTAQLNGKIEIASRRNTQDFAAIFEDVAQIVADARADCDDVIELLVSTGEQLGRLLRLEASLRGDLTEVAAATNAAVAGAF